MQNQKQIEELETPVRELSLKETEEVSGGMGVGKVSYSDLSFSWGSTNAGSFASGSGCGSGKVVMQDFH